MASITEAKPIQVVPTGSALAAEIRSVDLARIDDATFAAIEAAWYENLVLLFRNQSLAVEDHIAFSRRFGSLEPAPINTQGRPWIPEHPEMAVMSNIAENGRPIGSLGAGEAIWHTDMSYKDAPPSASLLYSVEIPADGGGNTGFANMYAAYEALPTARRTELEGLTIIHDSSRNSADEQRRGLPVVTDPREAPGAHHPAIRTHPKTGRKALFLGRRRNAYVIGLPLDESESLLDELWAHATRPEFTWHHQWSVGDLLIWDNRCVLHRRDSFDPESRRLMHRTQVQGDRPFL